MKQTMRVHVAKNWMRDSLDLLLYEKGSDGLVSYVSKVEMKAINPLLAIEPEISFPLSFESAQDLIDQLYAAGIRPTDERKSGEVVGAKDEHIKDLRKVLDAYISLEK